jgi:acetyl-CoA carboxylase carboxyltransferase component
MFPGRRGVGRIFKNQVALSGRVPQVCLLFGPSAAGGAYIPAFCDVVVMVDGNASMYLGSPRMAEMVIGEKVTLEEMGGAKMHTEVSGCGDLLVKTEDEAIAFAKRYLSYLPQSFEAAPPAAEPRTVMRMLGGMLGPAPRGEPGVPARMTKRRDQRAATYIVISKPKRKSVAVGVCQVM